MKKLKIKIAAPMVLALTGLFLASCISPEGLDTAQGIDLNRKCIYNGFDYHAPDGQRAEGPHCFTTPDNSTISPLAEIDPNKTKLDLKNVQNWDPIHPDHYLAEWTMATRGISDDAPFATNSSEIAHFVSDELPRIYLPYPWSEKLRLGANIGMGLNANESIPIYVVDSSNPHQTYQNFSSTDGRVVHFPKLKEMTSGKIPLPDWALPSVQDKALAIYDKGTGIWRSYFYVTPNPSGGWKYAASGYWYGDKIFHKAGAWNYWLGLIQGSSSVVGLSNELTQIGPEEVRRDKINHMISVSFPSYKAGKASFPAKQTDGRLDPKKYPNAPEAGQVFTFPKDFNVNKFVQENSMSPTMAAIFHAIQDYGAIVTDQNTWVMALNFANPLGFGERAENPRNNVWKTDPVLHNKILAMNRDLDKFPWAETEWLITDYAGH